MLRFMVLAKGTLDARRNIAQAKKNITDASNMFKAKGASIISAYAIMGEYDYMFITDVPDMDTAFELSAMIGTMGSFVCETYPIMPLEELFRSI
jgi:uncharacterized protein with GYD domain